MLVPLCLISCDDNMDKYYEKPDWLEGSIWDLLENDNNYSYFLKGVELTGFRPYLQGKGKIGRASCRERVLRLV